MSPSLYLAQLIGPLMVTVAVGLLVNRSNMRAVAQDVIDSPALMLIAGMLSLVAGTALVLAHNVWALDWRVLITFVGWAMAVGGVLRVVFPTQVRQMATTMLEQPARMTMAAACWFLIGAVLVYFGYFSRST